MNRSILIVICDFLVLSAMSLSIGVGEMTSTPGGGTVISRTAAQDAHIEQMHKELKKRARIQSEKAQAESELEKLRAQLAQLAGDVDSRTMKLNETSKALLAARMTLREKEKTLKSRDEELARQNEALKQALADIRDVSAKYENASAELRHSREETASRTAELKESKANLAVVSGKLKTAEGRLRETEMGLSYAKGSLSRTEKELAEAKIKEEASTKALYTRGVELEQTRVELANTKRLLDAAVRNAGKTQEELRRMRKDLADSNSSLAKTRETLSRVTAESSARAESLAETRRRLAETEKLLRSEALEKYSAAAVQLTFHLKNERFMNDFQLNETLYAPVIEIGGKTYLPGAFRSLTGLLKRYAGYTRVVELAYAVKKPGAPGAPALLPGPLWSLNADPRACLFALPKPSGTPLKAITGAELKKRGLQNLTLFKFGSFGTETASLNGRCSLPLEQGYSYLHIRNSQRSGSELPAEVGDFVISKEGEFIGVVVSVAVNSLEGREDALCYLYPSAIDLKDASALPLGRNRGSEYYAGFTDALQRILQTVTALDRGEKTGK